MSRKWKQSDIAALAVRGMVADQAPAKKRAVIVVGIDPGVTTGIAVWSVPNQQLASLHQLGQYEAFKLILGLASRYGAGNMLVRYEDANLRQWIPRKATEKGERGRAQGAGHIKRSCQLWEEMLEAEGIPHEAVAPKDKATKARAKLHVAAVWSGKAREHEADAASMVIGHSGQIDNYLKPAL